MQDPAAHCSLVSFSTLFTSLSTIKAFFNGRATPASSLYDSTNLIRSLDEEEMVSRPERTFISCPSSILLRSASLSEAIGLTVFIISWVRTRISLVQDSCSFCWRRLSTIHLMRFSVRLNLVLSEKRKLYSPSSKASSIYSSFRRFFSRVYKAVMTAVRTMAATTASMIPQIGIRYRIS